MTLNCKPNDLARVISNEETRICGIVDKVITVLQPNGMTEAGFVAWCYAGPRLRCGCGCFMRLEFIADEVLRPIRGQEGDDETLTWAGKPTPVDTPVTA